MLLNEILTREQVILILDETKISSLDPRTFKYFSILKEFLSFWKINTKQIIPLLEYFIENYELPKCKICNKFHNRFIKEKLTDCCSHNCQKIIAKEKRKHFYLEKYGVEHLFQSEEIKKKSKESYLNKTGYESALKNPKVQEKMKKKLLEKYGVVNTFQIKEVKEKSHRVVTSDAFKQKMKEVHLNDPTIYKRATVTRSKTNLEKYGSVSPFGSKEIQAKSKETLMRNYGVNYPMQNAESMEKQQIAMGEYRRYYYVEINNTSQRLQGYEPQCLKYLLSIENIKEDDIAIRKKDGKPSVSYFDEIKNKFRVYHPDMFIKSQNRIIEVKSEYTYESEKEEISFKVKGCLKHGFSVSIYVMNDKGGLLNKFEFV